MARRGIRSVVVVALAAAGCTAGRPADRTVLVGRAADAVGLDPALVSDGESVEVCEQIFEHLTRFRPGGLDVEPDLAESWQVADLGTTWTFRLRRGVRFHDGTPVDAGAVVFSFERQLQGSGSPAATFRNVARVERVDEYTVRFVLERPYSPFLANLAGYPASIVSPAAVRRWGGDFARHPVGSGPYRFVEWSPGERITLEANPDYRAGRPAIDHLVFTTIRDARQRLVALEGGAIDVAEGLAPQDLQFVTLHPELRIARVAGNNVGYLALNTTRPPFDDLRVRRAINHAVRREPIVQLLYQGLAVPATGPLAPTVWGHVDLPGYRYDPDLARRLLAEAKFDPRRRPKFYVFSTPRPYMPAPTEVARIIASNLRDVGIDVDVIVNPLPEHLRLTGAGEHDLALRGWSGDNGDPDNFLYLLFDGDNAQPGTATNVSFLRDPQLDGLLRWAQETHDRRERERYYAQAQRLVHELAPWVPLAHSEVVVALRVHIRGVDLNPSGLLHFRDARREPP